MKGIVIEKDSTRVEVNRILKDTFKAINNSQEVRLKLLKRLNKLYKQKNKMKNWITIITGKKEVKQAVASSKLITALKAFDDDLKWRHEHNDNRNVRLYAERFKEVLRLHLEEHGLNLNDLYFDEKYTVGIDPGKSGNITKIN